MGHSLSLLAPDSRKAHHPQTVQGSAVDQRHRDGRLIPVIMLVVAVLSLLLPGWQVYCGHPMGAGSPLESYAGSTSVRIRLKLLFSCSVVFGSL